MQGCQGDLKDSGISDRWKTVYFRNIKERSEKGSFQRVLILELFDFLLEITFWRRLKKTAEGKLKSTNGHPAFHLLGKKLLCFDNKL